MEEDKIKLPWRRLDNTANIFPVIANENMSQVFRISVTLKEPVQPEFLQQALEDILPHIQNFRVKLRRGLFWYYLEENTKIPQIQHENTYPCKYIDPHANRKFLFRVTYYERRINLEVFHALTDGLGAVNFLRSLTEQYLHLSKGKTQPWEPEDEKPSVQQFSVEDSYLKNYREMHHRSYSSNPAYRLYGDYLPLGSGQVLHGYVRVSELKPICHKKDVSITKYLVTALIWSIWQEYLEGKSCGRAVVLNLPINLRAFFGSETMSNFFAVTMIGYLFHDPKMDFDTLLRKVSRQMDRKIDKDRLEENISYNVSNEKKWYLRIIPLVIKRIGLGLVFRLKDRAYTMTLSNIGPIKMEPEYADDIERFHLMIGVSRRQPMKCAVCAYGDEMVITFTSVFADSRLQKRFFRKLKEDGVSVRLEGNELCAARKRDMYPRVRKILILRKGGEAKARRVVKQVGNTSGQAARGVVDCLAGRRSWKEELNRRFHV
ncbi:MAG: hypothetical protein PHV18_11240 [Lachnospiraceae bacterium]|nr:hypothetical protein [Lachnospiraceae bacterium]